jgi:tetratricopeptide (TPR) repeat protein
MSGQDGASWVTEAARPAEPAQRRLNTWKEIAAFFGCDERTAKRWEATRGLPVRRLPNGSRSAVFAYEDELKAWLNQEQAEPPRNEASTTRWSGFTAALSWYSSVVGAVALIVLVGVVFLSIGWLTGRQSGTSSRLATPSRPSPEAESFYRAGLYAWQTRTPVGLKRAVDDFTQAIVRDPQYAEAYAGLATCYNLLREYTPMSSQYALPRAKAAAEQAIALNPRLGSAHAALAFVDFYWTHNPAAARREFLRAIALAPQDATVHHWYATFLMTVRDSKTALAEIQRAQTLDTESTAIQADRALILFYGGREDEAIGLLRQLEQTEPLFTSPHRYLTIIYRAQGDDAGFVRELSLAAAARQDADEKETADAGTEGLKTSGHRGMLEAILSVQKRLLTEGHGSAYAVAQTCAELGNAPEAIAYLRSSLSRHEIETVGLGIDPSFRILRRQWEFRNLAVTAGAMNRA